MLSIVLKPHMHWGGETVLQDYPRPAHAHAHEASGKGMGADNRRMLVKKNKNKHCLRGWTLRYSRKMRTYANTPPMLGGVGGS